MNSLLPRVCNMYFQGIARFNVQRTFKRVISTTIYESKSPIAPKNRRSQFQLSPLLNKNSHKPFCNLFYFVALHSANENIFNRFNWKNVVLFPSFVLRRRLNTKRAIKKYGKVNQTYSFLYENCFFIKVDGNIQLNANIKIRYCKYTDYILFKCSFSFFSAIMFSTSTLALSFSVCFFHS